MVLTVCIQQDHQLPMRESTHRMYTTEPSATNATKYSQYVSNGTINFQWHKALIICIQQNHQIPMT